MAESESVRIDVNRLEKHGIRSLVGAYVNFKAQRDQADAQMGAIEAEIRGSLGAKLPADAPIDSFDFQGDGISWKKSGGK